MDGCYGMGCMDGMDRMVIIGHGYSMSTFGVNKTIDHDSVNDDNQPWTSHREQC